MAFQRKKYTYNKFKGFLNGIQKKKGKKSMLPGAMIEC